MGRAKEERQRGSGDEGREGGRERGKGGREGVCTAGVLKSAITNSWFIKWKCHISRFPSLLLSSTIYLVILNSRGQFKMLNLGV